MNSSALIDNGVPIHPIATPICDLYVAERSRLPLLFGQDLLLCKFSVYLICTITPITLFITDCVCSSQMAN